MRDRSDLREYQNIGVEMILRPNFPGLLLTLEPGLGKSVTTGTALRDLFDTFQITRVLLVAPLLVAEETWPAELEGWAHLNCLSYELLTGSADRREARAKIPSDIHIINKELIPWLVEFWGDDWPYDALVIDESSCFRNPTKRSKPSKKAVEAYALDPEHTPKPKGSITRFGALCRVRSYFNKVVLLTGTPCPNGLLDLWSQVYLIDGGERLGGSFNAYRSRWFESDYMGYKWTPRPGALEQITSRISDITLSMRAEDWLTLPERIDNIVRIHLPDKVMRQYKEFERTMYLEANDVEAVNNGVLTGKLLQLSNGSVYDEEKSPFEFHDLKAKALDTLIEEAAGQPVFVAYSYQFDLEKLRHRYKGAEVLGENPGCVARWNRGEIPVLLAHPASASFGLNLQQGGYITVWYGLPWSLEYYIQFNARLLRSGQVNSSVIIHHIVADGTVDDRILDVLRDKSADQNAVIQATLYSRD